MKYVHALKGSSIIFVLAIIATIFIPGKGPSDEVEIMLTISTFLFAILTGFFISRLNTRYDSIREFLGTEDCYWLSLYQSAKIYSEKLSKDIGELMDRYYMKCLDSEPGAHYKATTKYFLAVYEKVKEYNKYRGESSYQHLLGCLANIEENRNKSSILFMEKISKGQWMILMTLTSIITYSILYLKTSELYSQVITVLLLTILALILLTIRDLQNLRFGVELLATESAEKMFEHVGKLRYYNEQFLKEGSIKVPKGTKQYRLGKHALGKKPKIEIVTVK